MADPFAFSRQQPQRQGPPSHGGGGAAPPADWNSWGQPSTAAPFDPAAGSMGQMGSGGGGHAGHVHAPYPQHPHSGAGAAPLHPQQQQHHQPQPQQLQTAMSGMFPAGSAFSAGGFNMAEVAANPMAQLGIKYGSEIMKSSIAQYMPGAAALWGALRYYFDVNNGYVQIKLRKVMFPWLSRKWERVTASESGGVSRHSASNGTGPVFAAPVHDENAPDLYIPLMAFITFVLITGLLKGTRMKFTPEVLVNVTSTSLLTSTLEVLFLRTGMYMTGAEGCTILDLIAYAGYKYVGMVLNAVVGLLFGAQAYYAVFLYTAGAIAFFIVNTLMPVVRPEAYHAAGVAGSQLPGRIAGGVAASTQKNYFVILAAGLQFVLMFWLGHTSDL